MLTTCSASELLESTKTPSELIAANQCGSYTFSLPGTLGAFKAIEFLTSSSESKLTRSPPCIEIGKDISPVINYQDYIISDDTISLSQDALKKLKNSGNILLQTSFSVPDKAIEFVNRVIADNTDNIITNPLSASDISLNTGLILLNTAFVKAYWKQPLNQKANPLTFYFSKDTCCNVTASYGTIHCQTYESGSSYFIGLETNDRKLNMVFKLDKEGYTSSLISTPELLSFQKNRKYQPIDLVIPNGVIISTHDLKPIFSHAMYTSHSYATSQQNVPISLVKQAVTIEWDESGFSGAHDSLATDSSPLESSPKQVLQLDRPFSFALVQDNQPTPSVVFEGVVKDEEGIIPYYVPDHCYGCNPISKGFY
jgi:serine protease inhibitor